jgi:hypothetical protein
LHSVVLCYSAKLAQNMNKVVNNGYQGSPHPRSRLLGNRLDQRVKG